MALFWPSVNGCLSVTSFPPPPSFAHEANRNSGNHCTTTCGQLIATFLPVLCFSEPRCRKVSVKSGQLAPHLRFSCAPTVSPALKMSSLRAAPTKVPVRLRSTAQGPSCETALLSRANTKLGFASRKQYRIVILKADNRYNLWTEPGVNSPDRTVRPNPELANLLPTIPSFPENSRR